MRELMMFGALVIAVLFVGRTEISLNPFYIRMDGWMNECTWIHLHRHRIWTDELRLAPQGT